MLYKCYNLLKTNKAVVAALIFDYFLTTLNFIVFDFH